MIYPVGVLAALLLGLGYVLQQRVAATAPLDDMLRFQLLFDLMRRPMWWVGIAAMVLGQLLSGFALQLASVTLVEPLLSTNLLFALACAALISRHRPTYSEIGGAVLLSSALGVFIAVGQPRSGHTHGTDLTGVVTALAAVAALVIVCVAIGKRRGLVGESIWLASGAGLLFGLQDAATRAGLLEFDRHGLMSLFLHVWVYVVVVVAVLGILLAQSAFKAARLDYSLPPITALEPLVGIALGIGLLGDTISFSIGGLAVESACLLAMLVGVMLIGRSPNLATSCTEAPRPAPVG